jgi:hypothetical protein
MTWSAKSLRVRRLHGPSANERACFRNRMFAPRIISRIRAAATAGHRESGSTKPGDAVAWLERHDWQVGQMLSTETAEVQRCAWRFFKGAMPRPHRITARCRGQDVSRSSGSS